MGKRLFGLLKSFSAGFASAGFAVFAEEAADLRQLLPHLVHPLKHAFKGSIRQTGWVGFPINFMFYIDYSLLIMVGLPVPDQG